MLRSCLISIIEGSFNLSCSQIGSTSGPSRSPAPSQPFKGSAWIHTRRPPATHPTPHIFRPRNKLQHLALIGHEQPIVRPVPGAVLRIRGWVLGHPAETLVSSDRGEVSPVRVDDVVDSLQVEALNMFRCGEERTYLVVCELDPRNHDNPSISSIKVIIYQIHQQPVHLVLGRTYCKSIHTRTRNIHSRRDAPFGI
jgi:hypothetical protein